ncbi:MAG TPA: hypothetical protein DHN33_05240, partial [Eubacteriaceae bacterium]|nr:hypothetical protein [Eubacteriaceae bacterium]
MNINFKTKFIIANLFVVFVTMIILAIFVIQGLSFSSYSTTQQQLLSMGSDAQLYISQELQSLNEEDPPELSYQNNAIALSKNLARIYNTRVVLFNDEGSPLADSATVELSDESYSSEDIEIALTLNEGQSVSSYRRSDGRSAIHYAMPLFINSERVGVLFFIHSMDFLDEIISQIIMLFFAASLLGFVVVFIISHFMSQSLFRPIRTLAQSAKKMSAGNFEEELTYHGDDEIGDLILNFNKMSTHIQEKIQEIESEKQKLQSVLSSIEDGVIALDLESSAFIINDRAREILQLSQPELEATNILDRPDFAEIFDIVAREHKTVTRKFEYNDRILLAHGKNIKREDTITGILLVVRDITQIEELENQQRLFISSVSHELRTPLTTIIGYTNLLQRRKEENPELLDKSLQTIHDEGQRLLRLV